MPLSAKKALRRERSDALTAAHTSRRVTVAKCAVVNDGTRQAHDGDLFVPMDPDQLPDRLATIGFTDVVIDRGDYDYRFSAKKPSR
jgi:hypothetical protein